MGIEVHVDDLGTGYSSLALLQRLSLDVLKVGRASTPKLGATKGGEIFFKAILSMAHSLGMKVVAEGVETAAQLRILHGLGCDEVQGFYISGPVAAAQVPALCKLLRFSTGGGRLYNMSGTAAVNGDVCRVAIGVAFFNILIVLPNNNYLSVTYAHK